MPSPPTLSPVVVFCRRASDPPLSQGGDREFWSGFYNMSETCKIRQLKTDHIGQLAAMSGTVTRTSEVKPELVFGAFTCLECRTLVRDVEQQFRWTEPSQCVNPQCSNRNKWKLDTVHSKFVDWQRVRVQENADEIPAGAMPRTIEVILRNETVERAKPGDKCVFVGTLCVVPEVAQPDRKIPFKVRPKAEQPDTCGCELTAGSGAVARGPVLSTVSASSLLLAGPSAYP